MCPASWQGPLSQPGKVTLLPVTGEDADSQGHPRHCWHMLLSLEMLWQGCLVIPTFHPNHVSSSQNLTLSSFKRLTPLGLG